MNTLFLTLLTLTAFAGNSVLCRLALGEAAIDPHSFTALRLLGAVLVLVPLSYGLSLRKCVGWARGSWRAGFALYAYAAAFSLAYLSLNSGTGALILFAAVQITMLLAAHRGGERMHRQQWAGFGLAIAGVIYLVSPGVTAPAPVGALLMLISGVAWGLYSIAGRGSSLPAITTSGNFLRAAPFALVVSLCTLPQVQINFQGAGLALISGGLTSALGYVLWYHTLPKLTTSQASIAQLLVPLLASIGGVIFIAEPFSLRLAIASAMVVGGVACSIGFTSSRKKCEM
jgi:drug/metabolite transporter (DMT)-like permease